MKSSLQRKQNLIKAFAYHDVKLVPNNWKATVVRVLILLDFNDKYTYVCLN